MSFKMEITLAVSSLCQMSPPFFYRRVNFVPCVHWCIRRTRGRKKEEIKEKKEIKLEGHTECYSCSMFSQAVSDELSEWANHIVSLYDCFFNKKY